MGAPTSALLAEIFLQFPEHNQIFHILCKHKIIGYFRCIDILITYDNQVQQIQNTLNDFNLTHLPKIYSWRRKRQKTKFLRLTIINQGQKTEFDINRKPTTTDHIIHYKSHHLSEHKTAGII